MVKTVCFQQLTFSCAHDFGSECACAYMTASDSEGLSQSDTEFFSEAACNGRTSSLGRRCKKILTAANFVGPPAAGAWGAVKIGVGITAVVAGHPMIGGSFAVHK